MTTPQCDIRQSLGPRFLVLWRRCLTEGAEDRADGVWESLRNFYTGDGRHYHDLGHLAACLVQFDDVHGDLEHPDRVEMALWFHDIVHRSGRADNEAESARLFSATARGQIDPAFIADTHALIMATTHRSPPESSDASYICDIDMSSFGADWEQFLEDSINLRKEFHGTDDEFFSGKRRFLESLLQRQRIFYTDAFADRFEDRARDNIRRVLELISSGKLAP